MRILLIGEYSLLHNSLKKGLAELGHEVILIGNSNGYRCYPVDYDYEAKFFKKEIFNIPRKIIFKLFKFDLVSLEYGIRFYLFLSPLQDFDVVQFVNEASIKTTKRFELYLIQKIVKNNKSFFLLSCGLDSMTLKFYTENKDYKSIYQPSIKNPSKEFNWFSDYFKKGHIKIHKYMMSNFNGLIATDFDYVDAVKNYPIFSDFIPYPIDLAKLTFKELIIKDKIIIFLGINKYSYYQKGIIYFEKALKHIQEKYQDKVEIIITNTVPYPIYIDLYNKAHILLDQTFSRDQGYNALEAMAKGKVVFTGAENDFTEYYKITERVCVNALPDVHYLVQELSFLIENPDEIIAMGKRARAFVEKEHNYLEIAQKYLDVWKEN
ncbi:glycosyltransferase family protein [Flavobacterium sharifuzzamanii]|uniref:glycosyltransferase family protein n=1 Tax=Flavobacterium sharifuzzamanii TaxID=2211133 RepID=UPI000DABD99C|nr:glycosyltransferase [Flavobacterium sharifuzzamanii]KAF2081898.1 glycosyltransferase family 4 protein [Flavobacterium sharifuzzamanii]